MMDPKHREPRSRTILRHTRQAIRDGRLRTLPFSERVSDRYLATVAPEDRVVPLKEEGATIESASAAKTKNGVYFDRLIRGVVKTFPVDLEDAWVEELPQPYRQHCESDLAARRGYAVVRDTLESDTPDMQMADLGVALREAGEATIALAPIFANGVDASDAPLIPAALREVADVLGAFVQIRRLLLKVATEEEAKQAAADGSDNATRMRSRA